MIALLSLVFFRRLDCCWRVVESLPIAGDTDYCRLHGIRKRLEGISILGLSEPAVVSIHHEYQTRLGHRDRPNRATLSPRQPARCADPVYSVEAYLTVAID